MVIETVCERVGRAPTVFAAVCLISCQIAYVKPAQKRTLVIRPPSSGGTGSLRESLAKAGEADPANSLTACGYTLSPNVPFPGSSDWQNLQLEKKVSLEVPQTSFWLTIFNCRKPADTVWSGSFEVRAGEKQGSPLAVSLNNSDFLNAIATRLFYQLSEDGSEAADVVVGQRLERIVVLAELSAKAAPTAAAHRFLAVALEGKGEYAKALEHRKAAVDLAPLVRVHSLRGDTDTSPTHSSLLMEYGNSLRLLGRIQEASEAYRLARTSLDEILGGVTVSQAPEEYANRGIAAHLLGLPDADPFFETIIRSGVVAASELFLKYYTVYGSDPALAFRAYANVSGGANGPLWALHVAAMYRRRSRPVPAALEAGIKARLACLDQQPALPISSLGSCEIEVLGGDVNQSKLKPEQRDRRRWAAMLAGLWWGTMPKDRLERAVAQNPGRAADALFYGALHAWGEGDTKTARSLLDQELKLGVVSYVEYEMARDARELLSERAATGGGTP